MFMQNLDSTVIRTALPTIARSLDEARCGSMWRSPVTVEPALFSRSAAAGRGSVWERRVFSGNRRLHLEPRSAAGAPVFPALVAARIVQAWAGR
jgi:hypothetical protein